MIFCLGFVAQNGWLDGPGLYESAYANNAQTERTPAAYKDFANGKDAKRLSANYRPEKVIRKGKEVTIKRLRAVAKDVNKPGGLVISVDLSEHNLTARDGSKVEEVHMDVDPSAYRKKVWSNKDKCFKWQGSYTIDFNKYGEPSGTRKQWLKKSFDHLCDVDSSKPLDV